jgi:hypothetical protein
MVEVASDLLSQLILPMCAKDRDGIFLLGRTTWEPPASCIWAPTPLTEGPTPMAVAGVEASICWLAEQVSRPELISLDGLLSCIRLTTTLTRLAREMAQEAAGAGVHKQRLGVLSALPCRRLQQHPAWRHAKCTCLCLMARRAGCSIQPQ